MNIQRLLPLVPQVAIDDLEEKGNTEVKESEEETDDEGSSKGAIATQSTSQSQFLATEENVRTPSRKNYETSQEIIQQGLSQGSQMTSCDC